LKIENNIFNMLNRYLTNSVQTIHISDTYIEGIISYSTTAAIKKKKIITKSFIVR